MADRVGQQIGNYRLIQYLGRGGFAEVYLGEHIHIRTFAAIKMFRTQLTKDEVDTFRNEAYLLAHLEHPHIVRVFDFGLDSDTPFLIMDYAPNGTLRQRHPRGTQLPISTVIAYVKQLASALQYAHNQKLVHRDIKPENMLLGRNNEVLLSDFGIATVAQSSQVQDPQSIAGTATYMAPEQVQGKARPASDQYALGVVVYEWLTGGPPFQGSFAEIATQHISTSPPPLHWKIPTVSREIEQVVLTSLQKDPDNRFTNIQAFANALDLSSRPSPPPVSRPLAGDHKGSPLQMQPIRSAQPANAPSHPPVHSIPPVKQSTGPVIAAGSPASSGASGSVPAEPYPETPAFPSMGNSPFGQGYSTSPEYYPETPAVQPGAYPSWTPAQPIPPNSSRPGLSSLFKAAGDTLGSIFSGTGKRKTKETPLSLFAITRATLENDDRALVSKSYMVEAGISANKPENFRAEPFDVSVSNPAAPLLIDILVHASHNIELTTEWHKRLSYYPLNSEPQLVQFTFKVVAPGQSSLSIDFYHQRRWLRTVRLTFDAVQRPQRTAVSPKV